ncbi:MAG: hypothetical protein MUE84_12000 [Hyphomonas sp.]|nr:hypothetical protein [Hyphomonas sp.]
MKINLAAAQERDPAEIESVVDLAVRGFSDPKLADAIRGFLIAPRREIRVWNWAPGDLRFPVWVIAESTRFDYGIVYSENGFGPHHPWGLVFSSASDFGADYCWFSSLEAAFLDSRLLEEFREAGAST